MVGLCTLFNDMKLRILSKKKKDILVHWMRSPESYDQWLYDIEIDIEPIDQNQTNKKWHLSCLWLFDLDIFNEWMSEIDYAIPEKATLEDNEEKTLKRIVFSGELLTTKYMKHHVQFNEAITNARSISAKADKLRKDRFKGLDFGQLTASLNHSHNLINKTILGVLNSGSNVTTSNNADKKSSGNVSSLKRKSSHHNNPSTSSLSSNFPSSIPTKKRLREEDLSNINNDSMDSNSNQDIALDKKDPEATITKTKEIPISKLDSTNVTTTNNSSSCNNTSSAEQTYHIIIPSYSAWFDYNSINRVEKRALPEFFNGINKSKTPEIYIAYRNFMIDTYRLNPFEYLTFTACRRNLTGDVCSILRVFAFLEQWGLINHQAGSDFDPSSNSSLTTFKPYSLGPPSTAHFHVLAETPTGLLVNNNPTPSNASKTGNEPGVGEPNILSSLGVSLASGLSTQNNLVLGGGKLSQISNFGLKMDQYLPKKLNQAGKTMTSDISSNSLPLSSNVTAGTTTNAASSVNEWSQQEILSLLEGLEMYKDDWNRICEHVGGGRTQEECVLKFLQLPLEDPYLSGEKNETDGSEILGPLAYQPFPFSQSGNPVMSVVAFLASVIDPRVAASAAKAALEEFSKIKDEVPKAMVDCHAQQIKIKYRETLSAATLQASNSGLSLETISKSLLETSGIAGTETQSQCDIEMLTERFTTPLVKSEETNSEEKNNNSEITTSSVSQGNEVDEAGLVAMGGDRTKKRHIAVINPTIVSSNQSISSDTSTRDAYLIANQESVETSSEYPRQLVNIPDSNLTIKTVPLHAEEDKTTITDADIQSSAAVALSAAAVKAKHLASVEERKIKSLVALLVETQMKKLEIKLRHFEELEAIMDKEKEQLEYQRQQLLQERQNFHLEQIRALEFRARNQVLQEIQHHSSATPLSQSGPAPPPIPPQYK
ncbi:SWI/SNF complex subunit SMARCC2-like isoform X2 [Gordionus sp. m RMFG-2023]|uniref:SWI/SNF complex subunit SMARCC2-like isoform X2 n=1 Tax=Gordionus sp. m RMFG-2023 TaxID=3053472 RepID=UPI0031FC6F31